MDEKTKQKTDKTKKEHTLLNLYEQSLETSHAVALRTAVLTRSQGREKHSISV